MNIGKGVAVAGAGKECVSGGRPPEGKRGDSAGEDWGLEWEACGLGEGERKVEGKARRFGEGEKIFE